MKITEGLNEINDTRLPKREQETIDIPQLYHEWLRCKLRPHPQPAYASPSTAGLHGPTAMATQLRFFQTVRTRILATIVVL